MCPAWVLFLFLSVRYIESPGVYYDEALQANTAVYLTQKKVETGHCSAWDLEVGGLTIPLMCGEYTGAVKSYVLAPAFYLFGSTPSVSMTISNYTETATEISQSWQGGGAGCH